MLRKHQSDTTRIIDEIIAGSSIKNIIVEAVPGSGKSSIPIIAGKLITAGLADALCWVCPRMSLQDQAERNFLDPFFRQMFGHRLTIRSSTNENNPCRGTNGFVTTYQALGVDKDQTALRDFRRRRYILILDECHHASAEEGAAWTEALKPLVDLAAFRVFMSGTLFRGDNKKIAFVDDQDKTALIKYTRRDALEDKAILPLEFILFDGQAKWGTAEGGEDEAMISTLQKDKGAYALYTALNTEYARELLNAAVAHWKQHRARKSGHGKLLVVAANIQQAKQYAAFLRSIGEHAKIATSEDTPAAVKVIKEFKTGTLGIVVSVGMCYEGLDVPAVSHIACLTNIRSLPWISQMVARAVRIDPLAGPYETQMGHIFAPADPLFKEIVARIEAEQLPFLKSKEETEKSKKNMTKNITGSDDGFFLTPSPGGITALSSEMTGKREVVLGGNGNGKFNNVLIPELTASEIEADLLEQIESHIRNFSYQNRYNPKRINSEVYAYFGKPRREMTIRELEQVLKHVRDKYPLSRIRGTGRPRVSTKAQPLAVTWK